MGCGGSSTMAEDGSVLPGKGETKIEWNAEKPVEVGFYYYTENDAEILVKEFPMDKTCADKVYAKDNVISSSGGMHWVKVVPGTRYAMKYTEGGNSVAFPNQLALQIPKKIHAFHTKDDAAKDKLLADLKKEAEKDEGNAYNEEGSDDKIKADIEALGSHGTCADFPKEMVVFKKACMTAEDLQPFNTISPVLDIWTEFGYWDADKEKPEEGVKRQLAMGDKVKIKAEEEVRKRGPQVGHKALSTVQTGFKKVIEGAVEGACKKAGPEFKEIAPDLGARIDNMDGCVPGVARVAERTAPEGFEPPAAPEGEDPIQDAAKAEYEADKARIADLKSKDSSDRKGEAENYLKAVAGSIKTVEPNADNTNLIANKDGFQVPAFIWDKDAEKDDHMQVTFAANSFQDEDTISIPKQATGSKISGGNVEELKIDAFTSLPDAKDDFLERGRWVSVRDGRAFYQAWVKSVDGDEVTVEDQFKVTKKAKKEDVFTHLTQQHLATRGVALTPNFAPMNFWWVAAEDAEGAEPVERKVRVWRFGSDEVTEVPLKAVRQPAKPTKDNEKPTHDVHVGYVAEVEVLLGAKYAYNFKIGENYYVDFDKQGNSDKCCKVITANSRVEYA